MTRETIPARELRRDDRVDENTVLAVQQPPLGPLAVSLRDANGAEGVWHVPPDAPVTVDRDG